MNAQSLQQIYNDWINNSIQYNESDDFIEIETPFLDLSNDFLRFYIEKKDDSFILTDDGFTMNDLDMRGISITNSKNRKKFLIQNLNIFNVEFDNINAELYVKFSNINDYPSKLSNLAQCVIRIQDMLYTSRVSVSNIFFEEVDQYFKDNNVIYSKEWSLIGKSGNPQKFDFIIPPFKEKKEKLISTINSPSAGYSNILFPFLDIENARPDVQRIVLLNDSEKKAKDDFYSTLSNYNVELLSWEKREEWISDLIIS